MMLSRLLWALLVSVVVSQDKDESKSDSTTTKAPRFECPPEDGLYADPANCRRFYTCIYGSAQRSICPSGLYFDDIKKFCTFKNEVQCGPITLVTTTLGPEDLLRLATKCDPATCVVPDCFCSSDGTQIPGGLALDETPQMILLTFNGGLNELVSEEYEEVLDLNGTNPNGCSIKATFFVAHDYTNYKLVQHFYSKGHEIAINSITRRKPDEYWTQGTYKNWTAEMVGMREILHNLANVSLDDMVGIRGPFLKCGGNEQFDMMYDFGFVYDSSMQTPVSQVPIWPQSLKHHISFNCRADNCPSFTYPDIWEMPINPLHSEDGLGGSCAVLDQCVFIYADEAMILEWLMENFNRHYNSNRAPLHINVGSNWFQEGRRAGALLKFLENLLKKEDVYFVTMFQALHWIANPTPISHLSGFEPWGCSKPLNRPKPCELPKKCSIPHKIDGVVELRYMQTCQRCPQRYPWVWNAAGGVKTEPDVYEPQHA